MSLPMRAWLCTLVLFVSACGAPATEMTEQMLRDYYAAWDAHNVEALLTFFNEDAVYEDVATGTRAAGKIELRAYIESFLARNPDLRIELASITLGQSGAAAEWVMKGGGGDHAWAVRGAAVFALRDAHIARVADYWHAGGEGL